MGAVAVPDGGGEHPHTERGDEAVAVVAAEVAGQRGDHSELSSDASSGGGVEGAGTGRYLAAGASDGGRQAASGDRWASALPSGEPLRPDGGHGGGAVV